jgi:acyl-CoA thioester hydrolase
MRYAMIFNLKSYATRASELINSKMMVLEQKMIKFDGRIASEAVFTIGFFDMKLRKLIDASPSWLRAVGIKQV